MNQEYVDKLKAKFSPHEPFIPRSVFVGIPCHDGYVCSQTTVNLMQTWDVLRDLGIKPTVEFEHGGGICLSRNELTYKFMSQNIDCLFFIDADITFSVEAFLTILTSPADIAVGAYPTKSLDIEAIRAADDPAKAMNYPLNMSHNQRRGGSEICEMNHFAKCEEAATGFMRIKRKVIGRIEVDNPQLQYFNELANPKWALFNNTMDYDAEERHRPMFRGEDYSFCRLAKKSGFDVFVSTEIEMGHCGQYEYRGNFGKSLRFVKPNDSSFSLK